MLETNGKRGAIQGMSFQTKGKKASESKEVHKQETSIDINMASVRWKNREQYYALFALVVVMGGWSSISEDILS